MRAIPGAEAPSLNAPKRRPIVANVRQMNAVRIYAIAPDGDIAGWRARLKELFATSSPLFVDASLAQLIAACKLPGEATASTASLTAALEVIASLQPENEAQACLAIHIACLHSASLNVLSRMHGVTERNVIVMATATAKLERAYHRALETYHRLKHGVTQVVRVERVNVQSGAQAIVALVK
ncbi:MAG: hypothetical protein FD172_3939 [Methylocystaceae bacterium]|nr:MAG: hypothetical protein FD172_3939 [Methylocystaceae bacterium]